MNLKRLVFWSIVGTGVSSVTTQLLTIREFLTQFHGNEITISLVLFSWLLLTGLGSLAAKVFRRSSLPLYSSMMMAIGMWPLLLILMIRELRETIFIHGTSPGFYPILFYIFLCTTPYCLLVGFVLPYAQEVLQHRRHPFDSGKLYLTDSIGDIAGGSLFSFILVYWLTPFEVIAFTSALLILVGMLLLLQSRRYVLLIAGAILTCIFYYFATDRDFEKLSLEGQYGSIAEYRESPYGRIVISRERGQHTFWESGAPIYSDANIVESEEKVHYPLSQLDRLENVLLVSGGLGETIAEIAKHNPKQVDYVELDPFLTDAARRLGVIQEAPFLQIVNTDGRHYIKEAERKYSAIIIDLPDPDTFQINRFFTSEFFSLAKRILEEDGVLSTSVEYSPNYLSEVQRRKLSILYGTVKRHFRNVMILPGEKAYFICSDARLFSDVPARLKLKAVETSYVASFFYGNVTEERIARLMETVGESSSVNRDFTPRLMHVVFQEWFSKYGTSPTVFLFALLAGIVGYLVFIRKEEYVLFSTGFAAMGAEMLIVFAFQVIYGYIYLRIGAIVTIFLLGLLPGALLGRGSYGNPFFRMVASEMLLLLLLLLFFGWIAFLRTELHPFYFFAYCFAFAFVCGFQFPVAANMIGEKSSPAAGCLAADLCGAAAGTLVTGTILIPLWGMLYSVLFLLLVKISSIMMIAFGGKARK